MRCPRLADTLQLTTTPRRGRLRQHIGSGLALTLGSTPPSGTAGNAITFTQAMTLDASGNLLVGKTATDSTVVGAELNPAGIVFATRDSNVSAVFNRKTSDGDIASFQKDNTTVGSIGVANNDIYVGTNDTTLTFIDG